MRVLILDPVGRNYCQVMEIAKTLVRDGVEVEVETGTVGFDPGGFDVLIVMSWEQWGLLALERCLVEARGLVVIGNGPSHMAPVWRDVVRLLPREVDPQAVAQEVWCLGEVLMVNEDENAVVKGDKNDC